MNNNINYENMYKNMGIVIKSIMSKDVFNNDFGK